MENPDKSFIQQYLKSDSIVETNQDANAKLNALLNAAVDAIIIINHQGTIELFNAAAERMFGYKAESVHGQNIKILMPEGYQEKHDQYLSHYMQTNEKRIIGKGREVEACKSDGEKFPIELSVGEVEQSSHKQFVGIIRDISEQVKARKDAIKNRERLAHVSRLSTMGEMAAGIAHEINQPLTAVASYAQACINLIEHHVETLPPEFPIEKISSVLIKISEQARRASQVTDQIRTFVKQQKTHREALDLNHLIQETVELANVDTRLDYHGVKLNLTMEPKPQIQADPGQIQQVLLNLIRNAIDAMAEQLNEPVCISSRWLDQQYIEVSVSDMGRGVLEENIENLFDPFFSTKDAGMGMGLPISQSILVTHGGDLNYSQGKPNGSVFSFFLPATPLKQHG